VAALCTVAAARILFGAAALPFFADTDENAHFDLIHKFARGEWPSKPYALHDPEVVEVWIFDSSPEFLNAPGTLGVEGGFPPPVRDWQRSAATETYLRSERASPGRGKLPNHEAHEPPVYYAVATVWYSLGRAFGMSAASAVYWVRFLNVPLFAALVALAFIFCRPYFGRDVALAVAALTAFFPNTVFFTINADVLSPLQVLVTLLLLLRWYEAKQPGPWLAAAAGSMAAVSVMVKLTNAAVMVVAGAVIVLRLWRDRQLRKGILESLPLTLCAAVPPFLWCLRNRLVLGDWSGSAAKIQIQTWTPKPLNELLDHPLFTPSGSLAFLKALCISFFGGDSHWHAKPVEFKPADNFFLATSALLPVIGLWTALRNVHGHPRVRLVVGICALLVVTYLSELALLSLRWDFGRNPFPSRAFPFFAFGRLAAGCLVPFLVLYVYGIQTLVDRRQSLLMAAVAFVISLMVMGQAAYLRLTISSEYNWFHLP
jgi:uncharacterized membrane protein